MSLAGSDVLELFGSHAIVGLGGDHSLISSTGARALMRGDELVKPARVTGDPIKGLRASEEIVYSR